MQKKKKASFKDFTKSLYNAGHSSEQYIKLERKKKL